MVLLEAKRLCRTFRQGDTEIHAVDHVSFSVEQGDMLAREVRFKKNHLAEPARMYR